MTTSERRHELQHNVLADYLHRINVSIEPYSKPIAIVLGIVIVGSIGIALYSGNQSGRRSDATMQLSLAAGEGDAEALGGVGELYSGTAAAAWARLYQGDQLLTRAFRVLYNDKTEATELMKSAQTAFEQALSTGKDPVLTSRAHYGLARIAESQGKTEEAIAEYRSTIAAAESEEMIKVAQRRIDTLNRPVTQDFLAWFGEQDFSPPEPSAPPALPSGSTLPDLPDLNLPPLDLPDLAPAEKSDMKPADTKPEETKPLEATPGEAAPAETKPSEPVSAEKTPESTPAPATEPTPAEPTDTEPVPAESASPESGPKSESSS
jgi:hypothetical protein